MKRIKLIKSLFLITTCFVIAYPRTANAQWIPVGESESGVHYSVSSTYWTLRSNQNIRIYYHRNSNMRRENYRRGVLGAVNCATGAYTFSVSGDGRSFKISSRDYDWSFPSSGSIAESYVETVCSL